MRKEPKMQSSTEPKESRSFSAFASASLLITSAILALFSPIIRPPVVSAQTPPMVVYRFPVDNSVGEIYRITIEEKPQYQNLGQKLFCRAMGNVGLRKDWTINLRYNPTIVKYPDSINKIPTEQVIAMGFDYAGIGDSFVDSIARFKNIYELDISNSEVSDKGLEKLLTLSKLRKLDAGHAAISGSGIKALAKLPHLKEISFRFNDLQVENLKDLKNLPSLTHLDLMKCHLRDQDIAALAGCKKLEYLNLQENHLLSDKCIPHLLKLKGLKGLDLRITALTYNGLKQLKVMKLQSLAIDRRSVSEEEEKLLKAALAPTKIIIKNKMKNKLRIFEDVTGEKFTLPIGK